MHRGLIDIHLTWFGWLCWHAFSVDEVMKEAQRRHLAPNTRQTYASATGDGVSRLLVVAPLCHFEALLLETLRLGL
jgi:hypothetical protein